MSEGLVSLTCVSEGLNGSEVHGATTVAPPPGGMRMFVQVLANTMIANVTTSFLWFALTFWVYLETRSVLATGIIGGEHAEDDPHRGGLAGAVAADESREAAVADGEADVVEGEALAVALRDVVEFEHGCHPTYDAGARHPSRGGFWPDIVLRRPAEGFGCRRVSLASLACPRG